MDHRNDWYSFDALEDIDSMVEVLQKVTTMEGKDILKRDQETSCRWEDAPARAKAREAAQAIFAAGYQRQSSPWTSISTSYTSSGDAFPPLPFRLVTSVTP
jgi:hypothetical protein